MLFSTQVMSLFGTEPEYLAVAAPAFRMYALGFFTVGVQTILGFFFQGMGKGLASLIVASSRQILFLIPCLVIMPPIFGLNGLWAAYPVADTLSAAFTLILVGIAFHGLGIPFHLRSFPKEPSRPKYCEQKPRELSAVEKTQFSSVALDRGDWAAFIADVKKLVQAYQILLVQSKTKPHTHIDVQKRRFTPTIRALPRLKEQLASPQSPLHYPRFCSYCRADLFTEDRFCRICGRNINSSTAKKA